MAAPTFRDFVAGQWKTVCHDRSKPSTRRRVDSALRTQLLPAFGAQPLDRIDRAAVHSLWRKVRREAGLADVRLHDLRHTFASQAVLAGVALPVVARLLGHVGERMTLRYAHVSDRDVEAAAERIGAGLAAALAGAPRPGAGTQMEAGA